MFWKWSKKKEQVYHVGNEDVAVPEVHTGKVAHEQAAQQDTGEKENIRGPPKLFFIIYSLLFISQVFSASHWCMCSRIRAKAVAVSGLCVLKSISFHSQPWSATMQRLSG